MKRIISFIIALVCFVSILCLNVFAAFRISSTWLYNNTGLVSGSTTISGSSMTVKPEKDPNSSYGVFRVDLPANTSYQNKKITLYAYVNKSGFNQVTKSAVLYDHQLGWPLAGESGTLYMPIQKSTGATYDANQSFQMALGKTNSTVSFKIVSTGLNLGYYQFFADVS